MWQPWTPFIILLILFIKSVLQQIYLHYYFYLTPLSYFFHLTKFKCKCRNQIFLQLPYIFQDQSEILSKWRSSIGQLILITMGSDRRKQYCTSIQEFKTEKLLSTWKIPRGYMRYQSSEWAWINSEKSDHTHFPVLWILPAFGGKLFPVKCTGRWEDNLLHI